VTSLAPYRCAIEPGWIDYNGHLRDAYYGVIFSSAVDDVMEHLGLDAAYRGRTRCTLFTLEQHFHFLHEVKASDEIAVATSVLDFDRKRMHVGCRLTCARLDEPAAVSDLMLLHVHQGEKPASAPFPDEVMRKLESLKAAAASAEAFAPSSRKIELKRR
jgi:acyl-CoA thioester hydrolase